MPSRGCIAETCRTLKKVAVQTSSNTSAADFLWLPAAALSERALPTGGGYVRYFRGVELHALCASLIFSRPPQSKGTGRARG